MDAGELSTRAKGSLIENFTAVAAQVEELLRSLTGGSGDKFSAVGAKFGETLNEAKLNLESAQAVLVENSKEAARVTDQYVHEHPWRSIGIAAGVGLIAGLLIRR